MRFKRTRVDFIILLSTLALAVFGMAVLLSASGPVGYAKFGDAYWFVKRQFIFGLVPGVIAAAVLAKLDYHRLGRVAYLGYGLSLILLLLVFVPGIGLVINGSRSWLYLAGVSFQPAELVKLTLIVALAYFLSSRSFDWDDWQKSFLPLIGFVLPALLLVLVQPDVGTLSILGVTVFGMFFAARVAARYLVILGLAALLGFAGLIAVAPYRAERLTTFLHPELDPRGVGYQINQAFLAVGSGGLWGLGYGESRQKFQYLPEVAADSIFAVIAEEFGFVVSAVLVGLYLVLFLRGLKISARATDDFGAFLAVGIVLWLGWQTFLNIGAMVGALPLTGVPLPFVSHGGSAAVMTLAGIGILLNVSRNFKTARV